MKVKVVQSCLTICDPMDCPWNSLGHNTGVGSLCLLQGIFPTQESIPVLPHCRQILYQLSHKGSPRILEWQPIPSPADLPDSGIELGSPALQVDSLPTVLSGKPYMQSTSCKMLGWMKHKLESRLLEEISITTNMYHPYGRKGRGEKMRVAQLCPTPCYPVDYTVHEILQARILEWVAFAFSRGCSQPRDHPQVSHIAGGFFTS